MTRYPLNLPAQLKREAEQWASAQGVSLNQFIMWAVAEKVGALGQGLDDPEFQQITYKRGATGVRVQTLVIASLVWKLSTTEIAENYELTERQVEQALAFYAVHRLEIDQAIASEQALESANA
jgi:hypothetical protein